MAYQFPETIWKLGSQRIRVGTLEVAECTVIRVADDPVSVITCITFISAAHNIVILLSAMLDPEELLAAQLVW